MNNKITWIEYLRTYACISVVLNHAISGWLGSNPNIYTIETIR